jgi:hypothetical protein
MLNAQEIKNKLTDKHIIQILERLNATIYQNSDKYIVSTTVCHHGNSNKLYFYKEINMFHCYTDCGDSFDVIELICRNKGYKFQEAINWLCIMFGFDTSDYGFGKINNTIINDWDFIYSLPLKKKRQQSQEKRDYYNKDILNIFQPMYCQEWIDEGISLESMIKYGIKYCTLQQKIIIPHYSIDNELMGVRGRALLEEDIKYGKYTPFSISKTIYSHPLSQNLYGLNINKDNIIKRKKIMLVEAEKSVLQCDTMFGEDNFTVALCGKNLSIFQRDLILSLDVNEVIVALDKQFYNHEDDEANEWSKYIRKKIINLLAPYVRVSVLWDTNNLLAYKSSPSDYGKETLLKLMDKKIYTGTI